MMQKNWYDLVTLRFQKKKVHFSLLENISGGMNSIITTALIMVLIAQL